MSQVYFSPDFYYAKTAVTGESPTASPTKWQVLGIPADLKSAIVLEAASQLHRSSEQAVALQGQAQAALSAALQEATRRDGRAHQVNAIVRS